MKVVKFCLLPVIAFFTLAILGGYFWANSLPADWEVVREQRVSASPEQIHPYVEDLRRWEEWGIWYEKDPTMESTYTGEAGVGQISNWTGKDGAGKNEVIMSDVNVGVTTRVTFDQVSPFESDLTYERDGDVTIIRWRSHGTAQNIPEKLFGSVADEFMGPDFEANLARLAELVEANAVPEPDGE